MAAKGRTICEDSRSGRLRWGRISAGSRRRRVQNELIGQDVGRRPNWKCSNRGAFKFEYGKSCQISTFQDSHREFFVKVGDSKLLHLSGFENRQAVAFLTGNMLLEHLGLTYKNKNFYRTFGATRGAPFLGSLHQSSLRLRARQDHENYRNHVFQNIIRPRTPSSPSPSPTPHSTFDRSAIVLSIYSPLPRSSWLVVLRGRPTSICISRPLKVSTTTRSGFPTKRLLSSGRKFFFDCAFPDYASKALMWVVFSEHPVAAPRGGCFCTERLSWSVPRNGQKSSSWDQFAVSS